MHLGGSAISGEQPYRLFRILCVNEKDPYGPPGSRMHMHIVPQHRTQHKMWRQVFFCIFLSQGEFLLLCNYMHDLFHQTKILMSFIRRGKNKKDALEYNSSPFQYGNTIFSFFLSLLRLSSLRQGLHCPVHRTYSAPLRCVVNGNGYSI